MKTIYLIVISLLLSSTLYADGNYSIFGDDTPPQADYSIITSGGTCDDTCIQEKVDAAIALAQDACKDDPSSCGIVAVSECDDTCIQEKINSAIDLAQDACKENPTSCGIVSECDAACIQEKVNSAVSLAEQNCKDDPLSCGILPECDEACMQQKIDDAVDLCKADPTSCGIVVGNDINVSEETIESLITMTKELCAQNPTECEDIANNFIELPSDEGLSFGWHLLGTSVDLNASSFQTSKIVWIFENKQWYAYSNDYATAVEIDSSDNAEPFSKIPKNSGFWIFK